MEKLEILKNLVSIQSFELSKNAEIIDYLARQFEPYSRQIVRLRSLDSDRENLIIGINTMLRNVEAIILSGHIDTVPADKNYTSNPYEVKVNQGKAFGLGIIDMKCFFASIIGELEAIRELNVPVIVCITGDEETTLSGVEQVCKFLKENNVVPIYSIIGEPTNLAVCDYSKGCYEYTIEIKGKSCHSSTPNDGINSCYIMAKILELLESFNGEFPNTTINCGIVSGGTAINIVPGNAKIQFDIRSTSSKVIEEILSRLRGYFEKLKSQYVGSEIIMYNTLIIPELEKIEDTLIQEFVSDKTLEVCEFKAASEAGYFQKLGGVSFLFGAGELSKAHKADEYLDLGKFEKYNKLLCELLQKMDSGYKSNYNVK